MKCFCIGRNYREHALELQNPIPNEPLLFIKPQTAILPPETPFQIPSFSKEIHYECEVVLRMKYVPRNSNIEKIQNPIQGVGLGIDFTARDIQRQLKKKGYPWEIAKAFDGSAFLSSFYSWNEVRKPIHFSLLRNGQIAQRGSTDMMLFSFKEIIAYISRFFTIEEGDVIFTGTPSGVGKVERGDVLEGFLNGKKCFELKVI